MDFATFVDRLGDIETKFKDKFLKRVAQRTPVRTGALKAGWDWQGETPHLVFTNDVPYAPFVEFGTEKMAPRMMVGTTMLEVPDIIEESLKELGY